MIRIIKNWTLTTIALITFAWLTLAPHPIPGGDKISWFEGADKVVHALMLFGITAAVIFDYKRSGSCIPRKIAISTVGIIAVSLLVLSIGDELLQSTMGIGRKGDSLDLVADVVGIILGLVSAPPIVNFLINKRKKKSKE